MRWPRCRPCASYCTTHYSLLWLDLLLHYSLWHYLLWLQVLVKRQPKCVPALARLAELKLEARLHLLGHYSLWLHPLGRLCALPE